MAELYRPWMRAKRMPGRAIGVKWLGFDASDARSACAREPKKAAQPATHNPADA